MNYKTVVELLQVLISCSCLTRLNAEDINLKVQLKTMIQEGKLKGVPKLCKARSDLFKLYKMEIKMRRNSHHRNLQNAMNYLSSELDKIGAICPDSLHKDDKTVATVTSSYSNTSLDVTFTSITMIGETKILDPDTTGYATEDINKTTEYHYELEYVGMEMEEDGDNVGLLCEGCEMDYDDQESKEFEEGMEDAEEPVSKGTNKLVIFFSCVGIGLVLVIIVISLVARFGVKKINAYLHNRNNDDTTTRSPGYGEAYEMR